MQTTENRPVDGFLETADPETGATEFMGFWLPEGVTAESLGIERAFVYPAEGIEQ